MKIKTFAQFLNEFEIEGEVQEPNKAVFLYEISEKPNFTGDYFTRYFATHIWSNIMNRYQVPPTVEFNIKEKSGRWFLYITYIGGILLDSTETFKDNHYRDAYDGINLWLQIVRGNGNFPEFTPISYTY